MAGALTGTVLSGRYRLEQKLGSGGMSTVYLAHATRRWVAAKVLHREISDQPDQIERFRREARAVAQVSHPNVVAVIDAGEDGGRPYIVFEYCDGETLKERIERLGKLPLDEAAAYAIEVGRGLQAAHARRLVHRDVKPQNVLIDSEGRAKVTDFGIARELEQDGHDYGGCLDDRLRLPSKDGHGATRSTSTRSACSGTRCSPERSPSGRRTSSRWR
jgi:serine/threonine-protein kinase